MSRADARLTEAIALREAIDAIRPVDLQDIRPGQVLVGVMSSAANASRTPVVLVDVLDLDIRTIDELFTRLHLYACMKWSARQRLSQRGHALPTLTAWLAGIAIALAIGTAHYLDGNTGTTAPTTPPPPAWTTPSARPTRSSATRPPCSACAAPMPHGWSSRAA